MWDLPGPHNIFFRKKSVDLNPVTLSLKDVLTSLVLIRLALHIKLNLFAVFLGFSRKNLIYKGQDKFNHWMFFSENFPSELGEESVSAELYEFERILKLFFS